MFGQTQIRISVEERAQCRHIFDSGQGRAQAGVDTGRERQVLPCVGSGDVECAGVGEHARIAVGATE